MQLSSCHLLAFDGTDWQRVVGRWGGNTIPLHTLSLVVSWCSRLGVPIALSTSDVSGFCRFSLCSGGCVSMFPCGGILGPARAPFRRLQEAPDGVWFVQACRTLHLGFRRTLHSSLLWQFPCTCGEWTSTMFWTILSEEESWRCILHSGCSAHHHSGHSHWSYWQLQQLAFLLNWREQDRELVGGCWGSNQVQSPGIWINLPIPLCHRHLALCPYILPPARHPHCCLRCLQNWRTPHCMIRSHIETGSWDGSILDGMWKPNLGACHYIAKIEERIDASG